MTLRFDPNNFKQLADLEANHFWFKVRNKIILSAIEKYSPALPNYLEVGCGTGFVTKAIANAHPETTVVASEYFDEGLAISFQRCPTVAFIRMDARQIPFTNYFSSIGAFDVLEHIEEDELVLRQIHYALQPKGLLYLTIPQHTWLWSAVDEYSLHVRRYDTKNLNKLLDNSGFKIIRSSSFVSILLPALLASRFLNRNIHTKNYDPCLELKINPILNTFFEWGMKIDAFLINLGVNIPIGGSRFVIAQKE